MNARLRSSLGPAQIAIGVWAAAGLVTPVSLEQLDVRLAFPASPLWGLGAFLASLALPACRRHPAVASVALLSAIPWLPLPLPWVAYLWTGRLAWLPIGLACLGLLVATWRGQLSGTAGTPTPVRSAVAAGALTLLASMLVAWSLDARLPGGDEPHYLVITQSLLADGDLQIENNHASRDYAAYFSATLRPDFIRRGRDNAIYSIHAPGVSALVLPAFVASGYRGAQATVVLLGAIAGALIWWAGWRATGDRGAAWFAWASVALSATFLFQSVTIFPDGPGAAFVAAGVVVVLALVQRVHVGSVAIAGVSVLLAALPFLHSRFVVVACGLGLLIAWLLWKTGVERQTRVARRLAVFLAVPTVGALAWFGYFWWIYGTINPAAPYGPNPETSAAYVPGGLIGLLLDQQFGLVAHTPVLAMAAYGWTRSADARVRGAARALGLVGLAYLVLTTTYWMWWGGVPGTPARFAASVLPMLAVPVALAWHNASAAVRVQGAVLLSLSLTVAVMLVAVDGGALFWDTRGVRAAWLEWLGSAVDLARVWPSFFWRLTPAVVSSEVPFLTHAVVWVGAFAAVAWAACRISSGRSSLVPVVAGVWWIPATLTLAGSLVVALDAGQPLSPGGARAAALRRVAETGHALLIAPGAVTVATNPAPLVRLVVDRVDPSDPASLFRPLAEVPAGHYDVAVTGARIMGTLEVRLGDVTLAAAGRTASVVLPSGARALRFEADEAFRRSAASVTFVPREVWAHEGGFARNVLVRPAGTVYLLDEQVYREADAFWVRGEQSASIAVAGRPGQPPPSVEISNGARPNVVRVASPARTAEYPLEPHEVVRIPVAMDERGIARLVIASAAGFRPSAIGESADARYLGVRVGLVP